MVALKLSYRLSPSRHGEGKQERRGGIETGSPTGEGRPLDPKQERRGGIETSPPDKIPPRPLSKQERRGGIETYWGREPRIDTLDEAGTPWWH